MSFCLDDNTRTSGKINAKKPIKFDPNTNEHLEFVLKMAYKYAVGYVSTAIS